MTPAPKKRTPKGQGTVTHIALTREDYARLVAFGARVGAPLGVQLSPRQVVLYLLTKAEADK